MKSICLVCTVFATLALAGYSSPELPGQPVAESEASALVGGACVGIYARACGTNCNGPEACVCLDPSGPKAEPMGDACDSNCSMWAYGIGCTPET
jgi:hypothetical protein